MLSDIKDINEPIKKKKKQIQRDPMQTFYQALVAVNEPKITNDKEAKNLEYLTKNDNTSLVDVKRVKRHHNMKESID